MIFDGNPANLRRPGRMTKVITLTVIGAITAVSVARCSGEAAERRAEDCRTGVMDAQSEACRELLVPGEGGVASYQPHYGLFTGLLGGYMLSRMFHPGGYGGYQSQQNATSSSGSAHGFWSIIYGACSAAPSGTAPSSDSDAGVSRGGFGDSAAAHGGSGGE